MLAQRPGWQALRSLIPVDYVSGTKIDCTSMGGDPVIKETRETTEDKVR